MKARDIDSNPLLNILIIVRLRSHTWPCAFLHKVVSRMCFINLPPPICKCLICIPPPDQSIMWHAEIWPTSNKWPSKSLSLFQYDTHSWLLFPARSIFSSLKVNLVLKYNAYKSHKNNNWHILHSVSLNETKLGNWHYFYSITSGK